MGLFHRKDVPPAEVVAHLPDGERVVSWADTVGGGVVLATPRGLWWPDGDGLRLIGWQYVSKAVWRDRTLVVIEADVVDDLLLVDHAPIAVDIETPRDLPPVVRKRVSNNVVRSEVLPVPGGSARFVARRVPGEDGLRWWARLEGLTPDRPQVRAAIGAQLEAWRSEHAQQAADL